MNLQEFWQLNMIPVGVVLFMFVFVFSNKTYEPELTKRLLIPIVGLLIVIIDDNIDYHLIMIHDSSIFHRYIAVVGYNMRIIILLSLIFLVLRNKEWKYKPLLTIPGSVCIVLTSLALFTDKVFYYDYNTGVIVRGPLAFTPHITLGIYVLGLFVYGCYRARTHYAEEGNIIVLGCLINCLATFVECKYSLRGILMGTIALIVVFYYLYIHVEAFKLDPLTGCFNRMTMKADSKRYANKLKGLFVLDLNNLKEINDTQGHQEGDKAIKTLVKEVSKCLPANCYLYRTGGDEFVIFVMDSVTKDLKDIYTDIVASMKNTKYTWAVGYASFTFCDNVFESVLKTADDLMYDQKFRFKAQQNREQSEESKGFDNKEIIETK
jgi:diguanylate cyclase (GGDEF)-like protein